MMQKKLNDGLKDRQEMIRANTAKLVERAIIELQEDGYEVSTKLLIDKTGLSRPVFGKEHVLKILKKHSVCRYKNIKKIPESSEKSYIKDLEKQISHLKRELEKVQKKLTLNIDKNVKLEVQIAELKDTNEILRGKIKDNYEKAYAFGLNLE